MTVLRACLMIAVFSGLLAVPVANSEQPLVRIASKTFAESHVLGEIVAGLLEGRGYKVERKLGLGGTLVAFGALESGAIDLYPEYTGTLGQVILGQPGLSRDELQSKLAARDLAIAADLGFENNYAIAIPEGIAARHGIENISDLVGHPQLRAAFSHEFLKRADGWPALIQAYGLRNDAVGIEHALAYAAMESGQLDITDAYTTDGELHVRDLRLLHDDLGFFPRYDAVLLVRGDLPQPVMEALATLDSILDEDTMRQLNHQVSSLGESPSAVAAQFLAAQGLTGGGASGEESRSDRLLRNVATHLKLTGIALFVACAIAIPAALLVSASDALSRSVLYVSGLIQTIPALALLALLIPLVGLGQWPAIIALSLYSLLPIVRNTLTGLFSIDPLIKEVAAGMGLTRGQSLRRIQLPLAAPAILAGIKTAAIISIGTATLAAFVGAGGLGEPIITGLNLNDQCLILEGAIPAALLAIAVELIFELIERSLIPAHLRPKT